MYNQRHTSIVQCERVCLSYPLPSNNDPKEYNHVFYQLSFRFIKGGFYFLTGPSGVGKTSLLKLIYRELAPTKGVVRVFGKDINRLKAEDLVFFRQKMGLVFQDCRLLDHLSALENVMLPLILQGIDYKHSKKNAIELLDWVGMGDFLYGLPEALSDGQKQRIAIARAVITRPLLLIADEPTGNVDEKTGWRLIHLFEELNRIGTTVIMATHNTKLVDAFKYPEVSIVEGRLVDVSERSRYVG